MARRRTSREVTTGTSIFSFETPSRDHRTNRDSTGDSTERVSNRSARELLRDLMETDSSSPRSITGSRRNTNSPSGTPPTSSSSVHSSSATIENQRTTPAATSESSEHSREIKILREQQKKLAASSARIEEMLKILMASKENDSPRHPVPRELSSIVRDAYSKLTDEENLEWNYSARFDDESNKEVTSLLIRNVMAVTKDDQYGFSMVKRASRTYFKTKKSAYQRKRTGKQAATATSARRRQRKHNKAHSRLRALNLSTTLTSEEKEKIKPVLIADFMSSDESDNDDSTSEPRSQQADSSDSECDQHDDERPSRKKKLIRHKLRWRSRELQLTIDSLDRKLARRRSDRAKAMCLEIKYGSYSSRPAPPNSPEWAIELFS